MHNTETLSGKKMLEYIAAWLKNEIDTCLKNDLPIEHLESELNAVNKFLYNKSLRTHTTSQIT